MEVGHKKNETHFVIVVFGLIVIITAGVILGTLFFSKSATVAEVAQG